MDKEKIHYIRRLRDNEKLTFRQIAQKLLITPGYAGMLYKCGSDGINIKSCIENREKRIKKLQGEIEKLKDKLK